MSYSITHQFCSQVEDLTTMCCLFSNLKKREDIPIILDGYTRIRVPRNNLLQSTELKALDMISLVGPEAEARDQALRASANAENQDDEWHAKLWAEYLEFYDYDARDAADEWWHQWGRFTDKLNTDGGFEDSSEGSEFS